MKLAYKEFGSGKTIIIIHGLYGSSDNWVSIARTLESKYHLIVPDMRNHGESPHSDTHTYNDMVNDLHELALDLDLQNIIIAGHSMGGKVAMLFAAKFPELVKKLIVIDISPFSNNNRLNLSVVKEDHKNILNNLNTLAMEGVQSRGDAENHMKKDIANKTIRLFLLKNLKKTEQNKYSWKINVGVLLNNIDNILGEIDLHPYKENLAAIPTLFIKGGKSPYLIEADFESISSIFKQVNFKVIEDTGHWIHAEKPKEFTEACISFIH